MSGEAEEKEMMGRREKGMSRKTTIRMEEEKGDRKEEWTNDTFLKQ